MLVDCIIIRQVGEQVATQGVALRPGRHGMGLRNKKLEPGEAIEVTDEIRAKCEKLVRQGLCEIVRTTPTRELTFSDVHEAWNASPRHNSKRDQEFRDAVKENTIANLTARKEKEEAAAKVARAEASRPRRASATKDDE